MKLRNYRYFMGDFETTVYDGQEFTEVWASAVVEFGTEEVRVDNAISDFLNYMFKLEGHKICYFHNLKFDGEFIIYYLINNLHFTQAFLDGTPEHGFLPESKMLNNTFKYAISDRGQWYNIVIKTRGKILELRDSLKLIPISVKSIGESFGTKHKKTEIEYKGYRYSGGEIKQTEKEYIKNDVLVPKEALEIMFDQGHKKLTIGSCCLAEFKEIFAKENIDKYDDFFPNLYNEKIEEEKYGYPTVGNYILKSYKGAFCHLASGKENKVFKNGMTLDVNSLYPYVMHSKSGNYYPVGKPTFWEGNYIPENALIGNRYFFIRVRARFYLKEGKLPYIQIKGNYLYSPTKHLTTSDIYDKKSGKYYRYYKDKEGIVRDSSVEMVLTMTDYEIIKEQYDLVDFEIIDGCWFYTQIGIFDSYIDKYKKIKMNSKGAVRQIAKLFSNNLYGKMASSTNSSFKIVTQKETGELGFKIITEYDKEPGYIPIGSAITSYARKHAFTVAQLNYHGPDKPGFIYCDTDSIHIDLPLDDIKGVTIHESEYGCWKPEAQWDEGLFVRQKTYIEHVVSENFKPCNPYYNITCAGMPDKCKDLFRTSLGNKLKYSEAKEQFDEASMKFLFDEQKRFIQREITDFRRGLVIPGKLYPTHIIGGVLLVEGLYSMK